MENTMTSRISCAIGLVLLTIGTTFAAQRTFVSGAGNDANPCSLVAPCRGFAAAVAQTAAGGEVVVLDSAGYGPVTITQSVSLIAPPGVYAGISVFSPDNGVTVNGAGIDVVLRGLSINGQGGNTGIEFTNGNSLSVENCIVSGMTQRGFEATATGATMYVKDSEFRRNGFSGMRFAAALEATVDRVRIEANGSSGLFAEMGASVSVSNSIVSGNGGDGIAAFSNGGTTRLAVVDSVVTSQLSDASGILAFTNGAGPATVLLTVERATVTRNTVGISVAASGGSTVVRANVSNSAITASTFNGLGLSLGAVVVATHNTITRNGTGVSNSASTFASLQDNAVTGNTTDHTGAVSPITYY
jgi:hypothetical protein